jgi:hypothetical protein
LTASCCFSHSFASSAVISSPLLFASSMSRESRSYDKSSFQSFYPEALKIDIRAPDSLDRLSRM